MKYIFNINKDLNFLEFIRSILKFEKTNGFLFSCNTYFHSIIGDLSEEEKIVLNYFGNKFFTDDYIIVHNIKIKSGLSFLWNIYSDNSKILELENTIEWKNMKEKMYSKFENIWSIEYPKLIKWKEILEIYNHNNIIDIVLKVNNFFDVDNVNEININLFINGDKNFSAGYANPISENVFNLFLSNVEIKNTENVLCNIIHETVHVLNNKSELYKSLYKKLYNKRKNDILRFKNINWRVLALPEVIAYNVSSVNYPSKSYIGRKIFNSIKSKEFVDDQSIRRDNFAYRYIEVSFLCLEKTIKYLENDKKMDINYLEFVFDNWIEYLNKLNAR